MILIFDCFETIVHSKYMDFNRGLAVMWEKYYRDKCSFQEISAYGEELFQYLEELHRQGKEYAFVKEELPMYAKKYGGEIVSMSSEEEADFLMRCNGMENMEHMPETLHEFDRLGIPMYVLSNSGFSAGALSVALERLGIRKYFKKIWSSADYGQIKPCRDFFEMAIKDVLLESSDEKRENIIYIGDTYDTDVVGANAVGPNVDMVARYRFISKGDNVDGFYSGSSFANQIGISTQVPRVVEIVSNNTNSSGTAGCQYFRRRRVDNIKVYVYT